MKNVFVLIDDKKLRPGAKTFYENDEKAFEVMNAEGWGVFCSVNEFDVTELEMQAKGAITKRHDSLVTRLCNAYADLDIAKSGDGQTRKQKQDKKFIVLKALLEKCEPTKVVDTSNGLQPLWEISDGLPTKDNKILYKKIIKGVIEWSKQFDCKADGVFDAARVLRKEGYYHHKEEPYLCDVVHLSDKKYSLSELEKIFPFQEEEPKEYKPINRDNLSLIDREIENIDFQDLIVRAFSSSGRNAKFDKQGRLVLDGRLTGTFQGKKDDRQYLASSSHEPFKGNKTTAVADILGITNKEARQWMLDEYKISYTKLRAKKIVNTQLKAIEKRPKVVKEIKKRYTWGTRNLDTSLAIIKPGNFIVVGAARSQGKTTFTFDMACKNAILGHKVVYISLEMEGQDIKEDFARKYSGITIEEEYDYKIPEYKMIAFKQKIITMESIKNLHFEGIRRGQNTLWDTVVAIVDKYENPDLVFIDNLDLIEGNENERELDKQKRIVKSIMSFTTERNIPLVLIHHYRKRNSGKDYGMDELGGSGKISDSADRVLKISRNSDPDAPYPERFLSRIYLQKGRGYHEATASIYFIRGSFVDNPPPEYNPILDNIKF